MWLDIPPIIIVISLLSFAKQRLICIRALANCGLVLLSARALALIRCYLSRAERLCLHRASAQSKLPEKRAICTELIGAIADVRD
jgi:hypothetical protein